MKATHTPSRLALILAVGLIGLAVGPAAAPRSSTADRPDARAIWHLLSRTTFGPRAEDVAAVQRKGTAAYLDEQLHPERIDDSALDARLAGFETLTMSSSELASRYFEPALRLRRQTKAQAATAAPDDESMSAGPSMSNAPAGNQPASGRKAVSPELQAARRAQQRVIGELMQARLLRETYSERQLQEVLTDFWFNHFNVFVGKGEVREYLTAYERDAIRPHVLGRFRDLLGAVAHSPAMLFYLDNWQSASPDAPPSLSPALAERLNDPRLRPAERERLLARARQQLARRPEARQPRGINENYARELMELHTLGVDGGYTQQDVIALARILTGWTIDRPRQGGAFVFRPELHDPGTKTLLGVTFAGNGETEGEQALDLLARHPATAHHIAYELAQRFVADEPPAALVDRAAEKFLASKGDLREVTRVILTSPEFQDESSYRSKVKTPLEFVVSAVRATGADVVSAQPLVAALRTLGMPLYGCQPPTGYSLTAEAWVNTGALLNRMNVAVQLVSGRGPLRVDVASLAPDVSPATRDRVVGQLLAGEVSDATRQTLARADSPQNLIALTLGSPEFQRR